MPPLRERGNDIIILAKNFTDGFCRNKMDKKTSTQEAAELLAYSFPGNVRELKLSWNWPL
jgi:transcriptional regulator with GAF, ATPase, and Fis domain